MSIPFFSPIYPSADPNVYENCSFLRFTTHFFNLEIHNTTPYKITNYTETGLELIKGRKMDPTLNMGKYILKVILIATVVIPIFMLLGILIYRAVNSFQLGPDRLSLERLPDELYQKILRETGDAAVQLAATNKGHRDRIQKNSMYQQALETLNAAREAADYIQEGEAKLKAQKDIARVTSAWGPFYPYFFYEQLKGLDAKDALAVIKSNKWIMTREDELFALTRLAKNIIDQDEFDVSTLDCFEEVCSEFNLNYHIERLFEELKSTKYLDLNEKDLASLAKMLVLTNIHKAIEKEDILSLDYLKDDILTFAAKLIKSDLEKALEIANTIGAYNRRKVLKSILAGRTLTELERVLKYALSLEPSLDDEQYKQFILFEAIFKALAKVNLEKAVELANSIPVEKRDHVLYDIVEIIKDQDIEKALEIANGIVKWKSESLSSIAEVLAVSNPDRALEISDTMSYDQKWDTRSKIAISLAGTNRNRALLIANTIEDAPIKAKTLASIAFK